MRTLLLVLMLVSSGAFAQWAAPQCTGTAPKQCSWWMTLPASPINLSAAQFHEDSIPYASLVPSGYTGVITINVANILLEGISLLNYGINVVVVESPAGSGVWKHVVFLNDGDPAMQKTDYPNTTMSPGDEMCLQIATQAYPAAGRSPFFGASSWNRQVIVSINYTVP